MARERQGTCADVVRDTVGSRADQIPPICISASGRDIGTILFPFDSTQFRSLIFQISRESVENRRSYDDFPVSRRGDRSRDKYRLFLANIDWCVLHAVCTGLVTSRTKDTRIGLGLAMRNSTLERRRVFVNVDSVTSLESSVSSDGQ